VFLTARTASASSSTATVMVEPSGMSSAGRARDAGFHDVLDEPPERPAPIHGIGSLLRNERPHRFREFEGDAAFGQAPAQIRHQKVDDPLNVRQW